MEYSKSIDRFIECQLVPFEVKFSKSYPDSLFWIKEGKPIVEIEKSKYFWVHRQIWNTISNMFSLDYGETQRVMKIWLEEQDKLGVLTPFLKFCQLLFRLEEQDKLGVLTPNYCFIYPKRLLEEQDKLGELTPKPLFVKLPSGLEEQDKLGELTPRLQHWKHSVWLEEQYKLGELTPLTIKGSDRHGLEEQYKLGELTPNRKFNWFY